MQIQEEAANYFSVAVGLNFCIEGLQDYILDTMKTLHSSIVASLPQGLSACTENCSRKYDKQLNLWCATCTEWKNKLKPQHKGNWRKVNWKDIDTTDFPHDTIDSYGAISKVFIRNPVQFHRQPFQDFGEVMSMFLNMKCFPLDKRQINILKENRNRHFAHNYSTRLNRIDRDKVLSDMIDFLKTKEISEKSSAKIAIGLLQELLKTHGIPRQLLKHPASRQTLLVVRDSFQSYNIRHQNQDIQPAYLKANQTFQGLIDGLVENYPVRKTISASSYKTLGKIGKFNFAVIVLFIITGIFTSLKWKHERTKEGCLSMSFSGSDLDFDLYVETLNNKSSIEREWLMAEINERMGTSDGLLIAADMGYGKSSIIANIICSNPSSPWHDLKDKVLVYHFCRHDIETSTKTYVFIKNLAHSIINQFPEMGNHILKSSMATDYLFERKCDLDPVACFEIVILNPLRDKWINQELILMVDALDECDGQGRNNLLDFLYTQLQRFPPNIKFVLTSRNIEYIQKKFEIIDKNISYMYLNMSDSNNIDDIEKFIQTKGLFTIAQIHKISNDTGGNFLIVSRLLQDFSVNNSYEFQKIPKSLEQLYEINFERVFYGKETTFSDFIQVFEVLCTLHSPITEKDLIKISQIPLDRIKRFQIMIRKELDHFTKSENGKISFLHKSIVDFLTNTERRHSMFYVNIRNGHRLFAQELFNSFNLNKTSKNSISELLHHVAKSKTQEYENLFLKYVRDLLHGGEIKAIDLLGNVASEYNDYLTMDLLLRNLDFVKAINETDNDGYSLVLIAAKSGNDDTLKCLLNNGADIHFFHKVAVLTPESVYDTNFRYYSVYEGYDVIKHCKYIYHCGYNALHLAAQYGHRKVVEVILEHNKEILHSINMMHLNAFHLAAENGHLDILKLLLNYDSNMSDLESLYKASKMGHFQIVELLLKHDVKDTCLPCSQPFYWIPQLVNRLQQRHITDILRLDSSFRLKTILYDDWRLISCDTVLNAAVRQGHLQIVQLLLQQSDNALHCLNYVGKSSLITAIEHNQTDIFKALFTQNQTLMTEKCPESYTDTILFSERLSVYETKQYNDDKCQLGAFPIHILASKGNKDMFTFLMIKNKYSGWDMKDSGGAVPLHYAFCHGNHDYVGIARHFHQNFSVVSSNGSSAYHFSAICRSTFFAFYKHVITDGVMSDLKTVPGEFDKLNRSVLAHAMMAATDIDPFKDDIITLEIFITYDKYKYNFLHIDDLGSNFLHYAGEKGHYFGFKYAFAYIEVADIKTLLQSKDKKGERPIERLFKNMPMTGEAFIETNDENCTSDLFIVTCDKRKYTYLSQHELSLSFLLFSLKGRNLTLSDFFNMNEMIYFAIKSSRMYPLYLLDLFAKEELSLAVKRNKTIIDHLIDYGGSNFADIILKEFDIEELINCNKGNSFFHRILGQKNNTKWTNILRLFKNNLRKYEAKTLDECYDEKGLNLLHLSALQGNILVTSFLLEKGLNASHLSRNGKSALHIAVQKAPFEVNSKTDFIDHDQVAEMLLEAMYNNQSKAKTRDYVCKRNSKNLRIIHIASVKGLLRFIKKSWLYYGVNCVKCANRDKLTPFFLADLYGQEQVVQWFNELKVKYIRPKRKVVELLLYNQFFNFNRHKILHPFCRVKYGYRYIELIVSQARKCFESVRRHDKGILYSTYLENSIKDYFMLYLRSFRWLRDLFFDHHRKYEFCLGTEFRKHECNFYLNLYNRFIKMLKDRHTELNFFLEKLSLFGISDKFYMYEELISELYDENIKYGKTTYNIKVDDIYSHKWKYVEVLKIDDEIHMRWILHRMLEKEKYGIISFYNYFSWSEKNLLHLIHINSKELE